MYPSTFVICKFRYAEYKNSHFLPRHRAAGSIRIRAQLMAWVLERGPGIPLFEVQLQYGLQEQSSPCPCRRGQPLVPPHPALSATVQRAQHTVLVTAWVPAAGGGRPAEPQLRSYLRLARRSMRKGFGRLGSILPTSWQRQQRAPCQTQAPASLGASLLVSPAWAWAGFPPSLNQQVIPLIRDKGLSWLW